MMKNRLRLSLAKNLFNFKKSPILRHTQDKFGAVYNSEYARFASRQSLEQVYSALYAHRRGLSEHDVEKRRRRFGENIVVHEERTNPIKLFVSAFINPFIGVLTALILISFVLDVVLAEPGEQDWTTIIIISTMVVFSAILRFVQELKAGRSSDALLEMVKNTCYVERSNNENGEIPVEELVPGDIVLLSAGDMIPADLRIVETKDFFVSQSSLTGESDSIEKTPGPSPSPSRKGRGEVTSVNQKELMNKLLKTTVSTPLHLGRGWGWVFLLMTGGLHLHAQNHDVEYNCFITAEMDARLDGNDAGSYGITQLDIIKGRNTFHLGGSLLASRSLDRSFWAYTEHSIAPKTDFLFASYYDSSPLAPSKWYAGAGIHQQIGHTTLCLHYVWRQFQEESPSNTLDMTMHLPLSTKINLQPTLRLVKQGHAVRTIGLLRMRIELE